MPLTSVSLKVSFEPHQLVDELRKVRVFDQPPGSQPELHGPSAASDTSPSETYPYQTSPRMSVGIGSPGSPAGGTPSLARAGASHTLMTLGGLAAVPLGGMVVLDRLRRRRSGQHS